MWGPSGSPAMVYITVGTVILSGFLLSCRLLPLTLQVVLVNPPSATSTTPTLSSCLEFHSPPLPNAEKKYFWLFASKPLGKLKTGHQDQSQFLLHLMRSARPPRAWGMVTENWLIYNSHSAQNMMMQKLLICNPHSTLRAHWHLSAGNTWLRTSPVLYELWTLVKSITSAASDRASLTHMLA